MKESLPRAAATTVIEITSNKAAGMSNPDYPALQSRTEASPPGQHQHQAASSETDNTTKLKVRHSVTRSHSDRSYHNESTLPGHHHRKSVQSKRLGNRRVRRDGKVTYKKFETTQLMGSIQLGLAQSIGSLAGTPDRDLLIADFLPIVTVAFTKDGSLQKTPAHNYSEFRFRSYAPFAFKKYRQMFEINESEFLASLCSQPMIELSNPGASGSIFYITQDDMFICKTVQHKEADFLQKLLPGYYMNLKQNPRTLLPKFFGLYCYSCNTKNVRIIVMNNLLPSDLRMQHRFDLKGSTYKRKASRSEREKTSPTFKDLDFLELYPEGIFLQHDIYDKLMNSIQRDCRVLESFKIMDYSLLIGIHNLDQHNDAVDDPDGTSLGAADTGGHRRSIQISRLDSQQPRDRILAHSTALESITMVEFEHEHPPHHYHTLESAEDTENVESDNDLDEDIIIKNMWGGIPAKNHRGENLLLFIGIIDILQAYGVLKKAEHYWKSLVHDGDTVSVHRPSFYAKRFQDFMREKVFKKLPSPLKPNASFRRSHCRRTLSKDESSMTHDLTAMAPGNHLSTLNSAAASQLGQSKGSKDPSVTVIKIGEEVSLPSVLQDRQRRRSQQKEHQDPKKEEPFLATDSASAAASPSPALDEHLETGSVITMTSDERVQIYVPSPNTTPYNTITSRTGSELRQSLPLSREDATPPPFVPLYKRMDQLVGGSSINSSPATTSTRVTTLSNYNQQHPQDSSSQMTSLEMVKISIRSTNSEACEEAHPTEFLVSSTSLSGQNVSTDGTLKDLPSLLSDQQNEVRLETEPVSLSDIRLDG